MRLLRSYLKGWGGWGRCATIGYSRGGRGGDEKESERDLKLVALLTGSPRVLGRVWSVAVARFGEGSERELDCRPNRPDTRPPQTSNWLTPVQLASSASGR